MVLAEPKTPNNSAFNQSLSESSGNPDIIPGQFIVILKDNVSSDDIVKRYGVGQIHKYTNSFNGLAISASNDQISALISDPRVLYVENDTIVHASSQAIPPGIQRIGANQSINNTANFEDVTIAILDTGIDLTHDDLNVDTSLSRTFASGGTDANDKNGHGTHVAGTAAAINNDIGVVGVAQNATLVAVKVLGNGGSGSTSDIIAGINYVTSLNTDNPGTIDVINMSLGGNGPCGSYQAAINAANAVNVTTVVAAGNASDDAANHRPANCDGVITVSAMKDTDGLPGGNGTSGDDKFASFSNYGPKVDISAPGVSIYSTWKGNGYNTISGTSMASPHVAGAVAVIKHNNGGSMTFDQVLTQLTNQAIAQTSDLSNENGVDCSTDPDSVHEKLVYLGNDSTSGTCNTSGFGGGSGGGSGNSDPTPTSCTDPEDGLLKIIVSMDLQQKGPWDHLLIPVSVTDGTNGVSNICVDLDLDRAGNHWDFLGTTDGDGNVVFKLSRALDSTPYTATVVNSNHFPNNSTYTECKQITGGSLGDC
jgi:subtilisin family serine protease